MRRRGGDPLSSDAFARRSRSYTPAAPNLFGPKFFALANPRVTIFPRVKFTLPKLFFWKKGKLRNAKVVLSLRQGPNGLFVLMTNASFQVDVGYVAARQQAIELAMVLSTKTAWSWELSVCQRVWPHGMTIGVLRCIGLAPTIQPTAGPF